MGLSRTVSEVKGGTFNILQLLYLTPLLRGFPLKFCNGAAIKKTRTMPPPEVHSFRHALHAYVLETVHGKGWRHFKISQSSVKYYLMVKLTSSSAIRSWAALWKNPIWHSDNIVCKVLWGAKVCRNVNDTVLPVICFRGITALCLTVAWWWYFNRLDMPQWWHVLTQLWWLLQGFSQGWPKPPSIPLRKIITEKQFILFTTFTLHIKLHSDLQWRRNAWNVLRRCKSTDVINVNYWSIFHHCSTAIWLCNMNMKMLKVPPFSAFIDLHSHVPVNVVFLKAKWLFAWVMSFISTNQTIHHPQIGDFNWMTVSVNFLIEFSTVAVHFRYHRCMRRLVNEFLCQNPILKYRHITGHSLHLSIFGHPQFLPAWRTLVRSLPSKDVCPSVGHTPVLCLNG